jgi:hypothetical protein
MLITQTVYLYSSPGGKPLQTTTTTTTFFFFFFFFFFFGLFPPL